MFSTVDESMGCVFMECITSHVTMVKALTAILIWHGLFFGSIPVCDIYGKNFSETIRIFEDLFSDELTEMIFKNMNS